MRVGFISYDAKHLKTDQVLSRWARKTRLVDIDGSRLFLLPFARRATRKPVFQHRPEQGQGAASREIAAAVGIDSVLCTGPEAIPPGMEIYVVLGAGLLPESLVESETVVNAHPGIIPESRGLDAFKWAIIMQRRVGVTLHRLSADVDMGEVWVRRWTPVTPSDSLEAFARRHYEAEIDVLTEFEFLVQEKPGSVDPAQAEEATSRMPARREKELREAFERYKASYAVRAPRRLPRATPL